MVVTCTSDGNGLQTKNDISKGNISGVHQIKNNSGANQIDNDSSGLKVAV